MSAAAQMRELDVVAEFRDAMARRGIVPPMHIIADGKIHRCDTAGRNGKGDASYLLHLDGLIPAGGFQNWQDGEGWEDWSTVNNRELSPAEREELRAKAEVNRQQREAELAQRQAEAASRAEGIWNEAKPCSAHRYLAKKGLAASYGARLHKGLLVVPLRDANGKLWDCQFIPEEGRKNFLIGGRKAGCYHAIGKPGDVILIGEGFATCASVHAATGYPIAVAFDAGNLTAVAKVIREKYPEAKIVVVADDDHLRIGNPGLAKARAAAAEVGGVVAVPEFGSNRPADAKDFNDLAQLAGPEAVRRCIEKAVAGEPQSELWGEPDMAVLRSHRRPPPELSLKVFGPWGAWIAEAAEAAACPPDYVAAPLLACASALIGHARWPQAFSGWSEPPHLWIGAVGDSGTGKSPGSDCLMRDVLPTIEQKMLADFPDRLADWRVSVEMQRAKEETWKSEVRAAEKKNSAPPPPPTVQHGPEPQAPRLRQNDITIEKVAELLSTAAPKGLLVVRDELSGWIAGMNAYNDGGRAFWIEAYGGRPYRVERKKNPEPIIIPRTAVAVYGGSQPDKIASLMRDADDGLLARVLWCWPDPLPFRLGHTAPRSEWATRALDRLRELDLHHDGTDRPITVPLAEAAVPLLEEFGCEMQKRQEAAGGLLRSAYGKARGHALRLALVLEFLWWCAEEGAAAPPMEVSGKAFAAATHLYADYFAPMAERLYGDAALSAQDRNAATLARWIHRERVAEVHVRTLQRRARLPGLNKAEAIHAAAAVLIEVDWLSKPADVVGPGRPREAYTVNPRLWEEHP